ncbi:Pachytene checkpoint protein 2-like [Acipenser ruthenus]|uniref:Pachytene checkpoint protein 2 homolog n=1 Tax=Acipenser ruthenus TaxID=7906 RepID=A0A444U4X4_ACIRT|nr:Pachytene checkpoint protein 2-like [Acipenser ruthenus]
MDGTGDLGQDLSNGNALQIHVEVNVKPSSVVKKEAVRHHVLELLKQHRMVIGDYTWKEFDDEFLVKHIESVAIVDTDLRKPIDLNSCCLSIHIFTLSEEEPSTENLEEEDDNLIAANHWLLPSV